MFDSGAGKNVPWTTPGPHPAFPCQPVVANATPYTGIFPEGRRETTRYDPDARIFPMTVHRAHGASSNPK